MVDRIFRLLLLQFELLHTIFRHFHVVADGSALVDRDVEAESDVLAQSVPQLRAPSRVGRSEVGTVVACADARVRSESGIVVGLLDFHVIFRTRNVVLAHLQFGQIVGGTFDKFL